MELKQLGTSSVKVTPIAFGAWAIGGWMWGGAEEKDSDQSNKSLIGCWCYNNRHGGGLWLWKK